ncbi:MAG TPA: mevalonate kinase [Kofleriaceae bacterium]|nr:mevalonate kinase [Kofleriaceae bacterium]
MKSVGWGKIILLGEHAVVYGYPALAAALDRGVEVAAVPTPAGGTLRLDIPAWDIAVTAGRDLHHDRVGRALAAIADELGIGFPPVSLVGDAQIPAGAGLGSSAALAVAVARALLVHEGRPADTRTVSAAASASEALMHGRASGVDVALAIAGGIGVFRRSSGLRPLTVAPLRVLIGPSGEPRATSEMVQRVADATSGQTSDARLTELGRLTDAGTTALLASDLAEVGAAMNRAHTVLAELGVSTPRLDALCEAAHGAGAHGAKLTGAGGGGAVIAVAPRDCEATVLAAWREAGVTASFVATVGSGSGGGSGGA